MVTVKKICSARHNKHTRPGIGTLWSILEVNRDAVELSPKSDCGIFASLA